MRKDKRETLTLFQQPIATLRTFIAGAVALVFFTFKYIVSHVVFLYVLVPSALLWFILDSIPGPYTALIDRIEFAVEYVIWWVGLGVLSSIGLGSGLQSGVLFLFPHIIKVSLAAQTCKTLDFESYSDIWFRSPPGLFKCPTLTAASTPVTLLGVWQKIILACFLQSAGTAIGEIPPYWMTRAARLAAIEAGTSSTEDMPEELNSTSQYNFINKAKAGMIWFLRTHGFYGVLIMASYPNIAFDLCGIACGHFLMPFWTFFGATFLGKAIIRNGYQSIVYVMLCSEEYIELLIQTLQRLLPDGLKLDQAVREIIEEGRESFQQNASGLPKSDAAHKSDSVEGATSLGAVFKMWWGAIMTAFLAAFFLSCISHFAQYYQMTLDQEDSNKLRRRLPHSVRLELASPTSGRLKLPPPTPLTAAIAKGKETREARENPPSANPLLASSIKTPSVFLFPKTPSAYPKTPKTPGYVLREAQLSENNPMTPEAGGPLGSPSQSSRKRE